MQASAILKARVHGLEVPAWAADAEKVAAAAAAVQIVPFVAKDGVKIETDPTKDGSSASGKYAGHEDAIIDGMVATLQAAAAALPAGTRLAPIAFEKDDDSNFHMAFIAGAANMRARNYSIPEVDKLQVSF
jgi:ubiquitin-activating enzyme E1